MVDLQKLHETYADRGLTVLGFDSTDRREIAEALLEKYEVTYRSILDNSIEAQRIGMVDYQVEAVPTTYVIDREGKIADSWIGHEKASKRPTEALRRIGIE